MFVKNHALFRNRESLTFIVCPKKSKEFQEEQELDWWDASMPRIRHLETIQQLHACS